MPFLSSTPAVRSEDIEEGSKGHFSFGDVPEEVKVSNDNGSLAEDGYQEEEPSQKNELEHLDAVHKASASGPGPSPIHSDTTSTTASFSLGNKVDEAVLNEPPHPVRITAAGESSNAKPIPKPTVVGAFSTVDKSVGGGIKPPGSQTTKAEPSIAPSGFFLPATKAEVKQSSFDLDVVLIQEKEISVILYKLHRDATELKVTMCIEYLPSPSSPSPSVSPGLSILEIKQGNLSMSNLIY